MVAVAEYVLGLGNAYLVVVLPTLPTGEIRVLEGYRWTGNGGNDLSLSKGGDVGPFQSAWGVTGMGMLSVDAVDEGVVITVPSSFPPVLDPADTLHDSVRPALGLLILEGVLLPVLVGPSSGMLTSNEKREPALEVLVLLPVAELALRCHAVGGRDDLPFAAKLEGA